MKSLGVVIARFQAHIVTPAHEALLKTAMEGNQRLVVMLGVHSVQRRKDPLTYPERFHMVWDWWAKNCPTRTDKDSPLDFLVVPMFDHESDIDWAVSVDKAIDAMSFGGKVTLYCGPDGAGPTYKKAGGRHSIQVVSNYEKHATSVRQELLPRPYSEDYRVGIIVASERRFVNPYMCVDAFIVSPEGDQVLLAQKHHEANVWRMPGGFVDPQETLETAVVREAFEETGLRVTDPSYVTSSAIPDWRYRDGPENIMSACFHCVASSKLAEARDDIARVEWFDRRQLQASLDMIVHPHHQPMVQVALLKHELIVMSR